MLTFLGYKRFWVDGLFSSIPLSPHHVFIHFFVSFLFKNNASAPNIVEAMEQVKDPASLCLK